MTARRVGVALGSGGAKGYAHIGVLKALEEHGIPVHAVSGSSMGSIVAALYATGMRPGFMERLATSLGYRHWLDLTVPKLGVIAGERIRQIMQLLTRDREIQDADIPLAIVATELLGRKRVVFRTGKIADAVRASISIPGVFVPVVTADGIYVDGGVIDRVPVRAVRDLGVDVVIAVDVSATLRPSAPETMLDVVLQSLDVMQDPLVQDQTREASVTLTPDLSHVGTSQFHRAAEAIRIGYETALAAMDTLKAAVFGEYGEDSQVEKEGCG
ncbi:MAG: patatin-like phospholipase family protein [Thermoflavifilum sp.]|nr:patatin-like phospholipase family protein [Thermoflavifilum sp.]MCL6513330.1 patatin-like phospholipase family protein [Alicyclobacillus sp.]